MKGEMQDLDGQKGRKPTSIGTQAPAFTPFNKKKCGHHGSGWMKLLRWGWEHPGPGCGSQQALVLRAAVCGEEMAEQEGRAPHAALWDEADGASLPAVWTTQPKPYHISQAL